MPAGGGLPTRWTYESDPSVVNSWTAGGKIMYQTRAYSGVPDFQVVTIDPKSKSKDVVPLYQASEATYDTAEEALYFVRPAFDRNAAPNAIKAATALQTAKFANGASEAEQLTRGHAGESHHPMW